MAVHRPVCTRSAQHCAEYSHCTHCNDSLSLYGKTCWPYTSAHCLGDDCYRSSSHTATLLCYVGSNVYSQHRHRSHWVESNDVTSSLLTSTQKPSRLRYMTLWGVNLDAISMITIIMSIGFSVDYSAHIAYGYVVSDSPQPCDRIRKALGALGWPLTQGAASTVLAVIVLSNVPAYMIITFFKVGAIITLQSNCLVRLRPYSWRSRLASSTGWW